MVYKIHMKVKGKNGIITHNYTEPNRSTAMWVKNQKTWRAISKSDYKRYGADRAKVISVKVTQIKAKPKQQGGINWGYRPF